MCANLKAPQFLKIERYAQTLSHRVCMVDGGSGWWAPGTIDALLCLECLPRATFYDKIQKSQMEQVYYRFFSPTAQTLQTLPSWLCFSWWKINCFFLIPSSFGAKLESWYTVEPRFNKPQYNEWSNFFTSVMKKCMEKNLDTGSTAYQNSKLAQSSHFHKFTNYLIQYAYSCEGNFRQTLQINCLKIASHTC